MQILKTYLCAMIMACLAAGDLPASELGATPSEDDVAKNAFFESRIRPVLVNHCYECHGPESAEAKGNLRLDTAGHMQRGGDSGPSIVAGDPDASLLMQAIQYDGLEMPPSGRLDPSVIRDFERWIREGAFDPRTEPDANFDEVEKTAKVVANGNDALWSWQAPRASGPPVVRQRTWPRSDIDCYVLHELDQAGIVPVEDAPPEVLVRRLAYDLTGLPPPNELAQEYLRQPTPNRLASYVDALLASPEFGVHWGRHWLDVARYADSNGNDFNATFHDAWRYRDYVIAAFNDDMPFDQFVREQIAGDLLPYSDDMTRTRQVVATGFLMIGSKMLSERDKARLTMDVVDEQLSAVGQAFLGMTLGCARCHDHKFDPVTMTDYYALAGIFRSTLSLRGESQQYVSTWPRHRLPTTEEHVAAVSDYERRRDELEKQIKGMRKEKDELTKDGAGTEALGALMQRLEVAESELKQLAAVAPQPLPTALAVAELEDIHDCQVCIRGEHNNLGATVPRGVIPAINGEKRTGKVTVPVYASGRRELAEWIASDENPLTARVIVNRVWQHLIGEGLVRSVDNFGRLGDRPTHGELLDRLAIDFVESGWRIKPLIRRIVLTRTYCLSSRYDEVAWGRDTENRLLWRAHRKRLSAESIRDSILASSGRLLQGPGASPVDGFGTLVTVNSAEQTKPQSNETYHRSAYLPILRGELPVALTAFDFADPDMVVGKRNATTVPSQSLFLMNSPFVIACATDAARQFAVIDNHEEQIRAIYQQLLSRPPTEEELAQAQEFLLACADESPEGPDASGSMPGLAQLIHMLFASIEFRMLD